METFTWKKHSVDLMKNMGDFYRFKLNLDCSFLVEGQYLGGHKLILSAASPFFEELFLSHTGKKSIILKHIKYNDFKSLLDFIYFGVVKIPEKQVGSFIKAALSLQVPVPYDKCKKISSTSIIEGNGQNLDNQQDDASSKFCNDENKTLLYDDMTEKLRTISLSERILSSALQVDLEPDLQSDSSSIPNIEKNSESDMMNQSEPSGTCINSCHTCIIPMQEKQKEMADPERRNGSETNCMSGLEVRETSSEHISADKGVLEVEEDKQGETNKECQQKEKDELQEIDMMIAKQDEGNGLIDSLKKEGTNYGWALSQISSETEPSTSKDCFPNPILSPTGGEGFQEQTIKAGGDCKQNEPVNSNRHVSISSDCLTFNKKLEWKTDTGIGGFHLKEEEQKLDATNVSSMKLREIKKEKIKRSLNENEELKVCLCEYLPLVAPSHFIIIRGHKISRKRSRKDKKKKSEKRRKKEKEARNGKRGRGGDKQPHSGHSSKPHREDGGETSSSSLLLLQPEPQRHNSGGAASNLKAPSSSSSSSSSSSFKRKQQPEEGGSGAGMDKDDENPPLAAVGALCSMVSSSRRKTLKVDKDGADPDSKDSDVVFHVDTVGASKIPSTSRQYLQSENTTCTVVSLSPGRGESHSPAYIVRFPSATEESATDSMEVVEVGGGGETEHGGGPAPAPVPPESPPLFLLGGPGSPLPHTPPRRTVVLKTPVERSRSFCVLTRKSRPVTVGVGVGGEATADVGGRRGVRPLISFPDARSRSGSGTRIVFEEYRTEESEVHQQQQQQRKGGGVAAAEVTKLRRCKTTTTTTRTRRTASSSSSALRRAEEERWRRQEEVRRRREEEVRARGEEERQRHARLHKKQDEERRRFEEERNRREEEERRRHWRLERERRREDEALQKRLEEVRRARGGGGGAPPCTARREQDDPCRGLGAPLQQQPTTVTATALAGRQGSAASGRRKCLFVVTAAPGAPQQQQPSSSSTGGSSCDAAALRLL